MRVGQKLVHLVSPKWVPPKQFFAVSSDNTDFPKKLFNMKIFSIKFVMKNVILIFGVRQSGLKKNYCSAPPQKKFILAHMN